MVNWKTQESTDRLFASIIAAHPGLKLDYNTMAAMFGQGATYDAIEGRFRRYRKMAEELKAEARANGHTDVPRGRNTPSTTPRTPRGPRSGITKPTSSGRGKRDAVARNLASPSKHGASAKGRSLMDAIFVDDNDEAIPRPKLEPKTAAAAMLDADLEIIDTPASISSAASTATTTKVETPENVHSFASVFGAVKLEDGGNGNAVFDDGSVAPAATPAPRAARATVEPASMPQDVFGLENFYFPNPPAGYELDDIYGGAA
ncbi:hypothetical protein ATEIFO6365_0004085700 [Aspergillus terreus]|uniref:Uncharacterized protein n=1 Tax=Aspergillus terreus TaxID=33178 RepID=A0A5M3YSK1_ASPTE|nr:hypothetical protein ATETN484_0002088200 [Aspergillus terreus]GFF15738.1 hypothetical protein ATEIFO6365_0004085700 [Aspergillus terreus]